WGVVLVVGFYFISGSLSPANLNNVSKGMCVAFILLSLVLLTGYGGLTSLMQMTFAGFGAYAMGKWASGGSLWGVLAAIGFAVAWAMFLGLITLRLRGLYLALATFALAFAMDEAFINKYLGGRGGSLEVTPPHHTRSPTRYI